mgnify:CR=1 FL=1
MEKINAVITGVGGYVPDYILTNDEISKMVDTNDEWIMTRIGVKERRILNEEGLGSSYMARKAAKQLMQLTGADPDDIDRQWLTIQIVLHALFSVTVLLPLWWSPLRKITESWIRY